MIHEFPLPAQLNGDGLVYQLAQAGIEATVGQREDLLLVSTEADRQVVEPIVLAHNGEPTPEAEAEAEAEAEDETKRQQLDQLRDKALAVWQGTDTFTTAQAQRIIAGLVLIELRKR